MEPAVTGSPSLNIAPSSMAPLDAVLITDQLLSRPARQPNYKEENEALQALARQMAAEPQGVLKNLVQIALKLCGAGSAGVSLLQSSSSSGEVFEWAAVAGAYARFEGGTTPRSECPCGVCLRLGSPQLFSRPAKHFACFLGVEPPIVEGLVVPLSWDGEAIGTIWVVTHDNQKKFDAEDVRLMTALADFTAAAHRTASAVAAARQSEERLEAVIESVGDHLVTYDRDWRYVYVNDRATSLLGRPKEELIGQKIWDLFPEAVGNQFYQELHIAVAEQSVVRSEHYYRPFDRWFENHIYPAEDGVTVFSADVTWRKQSELLLDRYRLLSEFARDIVLLLRPDGRIIEANEAAIAAYGYERETLLTMTVADLRHEATLSDVQAQLAAAAEKGVRFETLHRRRDGSAISVEVNSRGATIGGEQLLLSVVRDISERKQVEADLEDARRRLEAALEAGAIGTWIWEIPNNHVHADHNLAQIFGVSPDDASGGNIAAYTRAIHPDDAPRIEQSIAKAVESGVPFDEEYRVVRSDDSMRWVVARGRVERDAEGKAIRMPGVVVDITDRREAEERLRRAEQTSRFLAEVSVALSGLADYESTLSKIAHLAVPGFADWCVIDMLEGDSIRRMAVAHADPAKVEFGHEYSRRFPPDPSASRGVWQIIRTGNPELVPEISDELFEQIAREPERRKLLRELGLRSYVSVPLKARDTILGVLTFVEAESGRRFDERDLHVAEDLAHRAAIAVENARLYSEVREADRRKDEFLAMLAHELRNPLAPIQSGLDLLRLEGSSPEIVEIMSEQVGHVIRLVDDLLDVSRILRGKIELKRKPTELNTVLRRAADICRPRIAEHSQRLNVVLPDESIWIEADTVRLTQIVTNLLHNASKYTNDGGEIQLEVTREENEAVISVSDTGIGIEPALLPRLFDLFVQSDQALDRSQGGLGIGLTVVKSLVEMHGGAVVAQSEGIGSGSTFLVRLPAPALDRPAVTNASENLPTRPCRVLLIDDNVPAAKLLGRLFEKLGAHHVLTAHDGPAALAAAEEFRPDIILLDIGLPKMDGYEVARRIRARSKLSDVLLVALTGYGTAADRQRSLEAGFDDHLVKPPSVEMLRRVLVHPKLQRA